MLGDQVAKVPYVETEEGDFVAEQMITMAKVSCGLSEAAGSAGIGRERRGQRVSNGHQGRECIGTGQGADGKERRWTRHSSGIASRRPDQASN
jgi:hypothetical protein